MSGPTTIDRTASRFELTGKSLHALAQSTPGIVLPSFATADASRCDGSAGERPSAEPSCDSKLLLALALHGCATGVIQLVSWSPREVVRCSVAVAGMVATALARRDRAGSGAVDREDSSYEVALLPAPRIAEELTGFVPLPVPGVAPGLGSAPGLGRGEAGSDARDGVARVPLAASRAIVDAFRSGGPALVDAVAAELSVPTQAAHALSRLRGPLSTGVRVRFFDGRTGLCVAGDDWVGSDGGWQRLNLTLNGRAGRLPASPLTPAARFVDDATISVTPATSGGIRRSLTWMTAALLQRVGS